jgi:hypothetical protein
MRWLFVVLAACNGVTGDRGYGSELAIPGAQFRPGPFPSPTGGPAALSFVSTHASVVIGDVHERVHAVLEPAAHAAIIGLAGVDGAWIVVAGPPDIDTPGQPSATAIIGLDPATEPGPFTLLLAASDGDGKIGAAAALPLVADAEPPPDGDLVVGLVWDSRADLDLHVVDPTGGEAYSGDPNTWKAPPPGTPTDPNEFLGGGWLDHDGNAACHRDGAPNEHVIWTTRTGSNGPVAPIIPTGTYTVRVDTRSLCGDAGAAWYVEVYAHGALVTAARGVSAAEDVITGTHRAGAGVTALTFTQP